MRHRLGEENGKEGHIGLTGSMNETYDRAGWRAFNSRQRCDHVSTRWLPLAWLKRPNGLSLMAMFSSPTVLHSSSISSSVNSHRASGLPP